MAVAMCACGRPLHYTDAKVRDLMEEIVSEMGENVTVIVAGHRYTIQRHYIALHGLKAAMLQNDIVVH